MEGKSFLLLFVKIRVIRERLYTPISISVPSYQCLDILKELNSY